MRKTLLFLLSIVYSLQVYSQNWNKISGISDSVKVAAVAQLNNQIVISGQRWNGTVVNHFTSSDGGSTWEKLPTFSFAGNYLFGLPQNNILLGGGFLSCRKLDGNNWTTSFPASGFAEFSDGTIIGGQANFPDSIYQFSSLGVRGAKLGNFTFKLGPKYFIGNQNRLFLFSYGSGFAYIDQADKSTIKFPSSLNNTAMTASSWQYYIIDDMVKTSNGTLIATDRLGYGILRSIDNGESWTTVVQEPSASAQSMVINSKDEIFVIYGGKLRKSIDLGLTFPDFSAGLPAIQADLFVNASDELFVFCNANGSVQAAVSGIYKYEDLSTGLNLFERNNRRITVYPNPASHSITIKGIPTLENNSYTITNSSGQPIQSGLLNLETPVQLDDLKSGVYVIQVLTNGELSTQKLIIE
jgi:Secretion system C-terminal sorting domain